MAKITDILNMLKIKHYIKNLVIFLPAVFTKDLNNIYTSWMVLKVFIAFCLMSSIVYIFNDIQDIEKDKAHPIKSHRPIASGKISIATAKKILFILLLLMLCVSFSINIPCNICIWGYLLLNICYSLVLKNFKFIDIICIALGFVLRILAGFYAISLTISVSMCLMTFVTSVFFTSSKRLLELKLTSSSKDYHLSARYTNTLMLKRVIYSSAVLSIMSYGFIAFEYTKYISYLYISIFCFAIFIGRLVYLVNKPQNHDDPMNFIEKDKKIKVISVATLVILGILYLV